MSNFAKSGPALGAILVGGVLAIIVGLICFIISGISYYNAEVSLRTQHEAQEDANRIIFEKFQKSVLERAGVVKASVEAQKELFALIMSSKSDSGGALVKFIQQHNPNPDAALSDTSRLFREIMVSIEGLREEFARNQLRSRDIEREHAVLLRSFFSGTMVSLFGGNTEPLKTNIIASSDTEDVFATGRDDSPLDPFHTLEK